MLQLKKSLHNGIINKFALDYRIKQLFAPKADSYSKHKFAFIAEEFFHDELRGFGGYGITVKNITDRFNAQKGSVESEVLLTSMLAHDLGVKRFHNADVIFRPSNLKSYVKNFYKYGSIVNSRNIDLLISIDWYKSYEYAAQALPKTPLIIWIKDPRGRRHWENIASVPLELKVSGSDYSVEKLNDILKRKRDSVHRVVELSQKHGRKLIFGSQAECLIERAKDSYDLDEIESIFLPNIVNIPDISDQKLSERPSVCLLGRLEPVKRPWIYCALAERFPQVDFLVAGKAHYPEVMDPVLDKYKDLPNLKFLGLVYGEDKHQLLNSTWAFVNTSVHEGLPNAFLEAFAYGKPVISCQNPDDLVARYGYSTGEVLGEGLDEDTLSKFGSAITEFLGDEQKRIEKGRRAREFMQEKYSFTSFQNVINKVLRNIKKD